MTQNQNKPAHGALAAYLMAGTLPHALLIESADSAESLAFARLAAQGAMCTGVEKPCGVCRDCQKNEKGVHPDVLLYSGGGGARSFHVETVRELRGEAYVRAGEAPCKALILQDVQNMSVQAQNALLKVIEEPPPGVLFLLTCENRTAMLETILSRVTVLTLDNPAVREEFLQQAVRLLCDMCAGSETDALAALAAYERDRPGLQELLACLREAVCGMILGKTALPDDARRVQNKISRLQLFKILAIIDDIAAGLRGNVNGLLLCTALCAKIRLALSEG